MAIKNGTEYSGNYETNVCIIGSGPAGITAAWYLLSKGVKNITLLEGGLDFGFSKDAYQKSWPDKKLLYRGVAEGLFKKNECDFLIRPYYEKGGPWERERVYGGTSNHWGGQCRPLDPITFKGERPGFPAWPIRRDELDPYYTEAASFLKLDGHDFTAKYWATKVGGKVPELAGFCAEMYQFIHEDFNFAQRTSIGNSPLVDVIVNANLLNIEHSDGVVKRLHLASMDESSKKPKTTFYMKANAYVLACGAVENARQLLLSNAGNEHDKVGRYFMCHPLAPGVGGKTADPDPVTIKKGFLSDDEQLLMSGGDWRGSHGATVEGRFSLTEEVQRTWGIGSCWFWAGQVGGFPFLFEMAPNPDSRVTLDEATDPVFCQKQTKITWELSGTDKKTFEHAAELFKNAVEKPPRHGEVSILEWEEVKRQLVVNGHHIGTTRMANDPTQGVVDKNLKVHSLKNLYVAGSSVFCSAGISNPTFTIVALSIRLAKHLSEKLKG